MADLIVVTGPPGAGKTTVSRVLSALYEPSALVAGDNFFAFIDQGYIAPWTAEAHHQNEIVIDAAAAAAGRLAIGGYTVIYDGVIGPWFLPPFVAATGVATLHYALLLPPEEICLDRVGFRTGHGFKDPDATRQMHREFGYSDIHPRHIIEATEPPEVTASSIFRLVQDRALVWPSENNPAPTS